MKGLTRRALLRVLQASRFVIESAMLKTTSCMPQHRTFIAYGGIVLMLVLAGWLATLPAHATTVGWHVAIDGEQGVPGGWVQVRENAIQGTRLDLHNDLDARHMQTLRLRAWEPLSSVSQLHIGFATSRITGHTIINAPAYFNGTTIAPGRLETTTQFQDLLAFDFSYWRRLVAFGHGGRLWASVGAQYVMLNFKLNGTIASNSVGHELKEDFYVQELPVPTLGLHLRYPLMRGLKLTADVVAGRLPWVNSLRTEGGEVRLAQTDEKMTLGLAYRFTRRWQLRMYVFHDYLNQDERSHEDGNDIKLRSNGVGLGVGFQF